MKKILITGKNSYIGDMFCKYTNEYFCVHSVDTCTNEWEKTDFSLYDVVLHVAAIVHKADRAFSDEEYYAVNTELSYNVAKKAKESGVKRFVFISTMSVYGVVNGVITKDTQTKPFNIYGKTKLEAEKKIMSLCDDSFFVSVLRPPLVYGKGCKGNYNELAQFAKSKPVFPDYKSQRSMIFIDNLCEFIRVCIDEKLCGVFCPQDEHYVKTSDMVRLIAQTNGKKIRLTKFFNPFITLALKLKINIICKVFGTLVYDKDLCPEYKKVDFYTAIERTEN